MNLTIQVQEKTASISSTFVASSAITNEQLARHGLEVDPVSGYARHDTSLVMFLQFYTCTSAAELALQDDAVSKMTLLGAFSLMYQIGQAVGGLIVPPSSDLFGRRMPYLLSCALFSLSPLIVGAVPHVSTVFIGRFFSGLASAVPSVFVSGTVGEQFNTERRVWIALLWNAAATAGLAFGPVYASCISMVASRSLQRAGAELKYHTADPFPTLRSFINIASLRQTVVMVPEPILTIVSSISAISWGIIYLFTESLTDTFTMLNLSRTAASLPFLALTIGVILDAVPHIWEENPHRVRGQITSFTYGTVALAAGRWWFYATTPPAMTAHPLLPTAAFIPIDFGANEIAYTLSGYLADTYTVYAASAFAGLAFVRAIVAGIGPLVGHVLFTGEHSVVPGYVISGLGTLSRFRQRSGFVQYSFAVHQLTQVDV
ncbi:major facilitator superfamily domain-containing protein [Aspergillus aurantiobrunneus]